MHRELQSEADLLTVQLRTDVERLQELAAAMQGLENLGVPVSSKMALPAVQAVHPIDSESEAQVHNTTGASSSAVSHVDDNADLRRPYQGSPLFPMQTQPSVASVASQPHQESRQECKQQ